MFRSYSEKIRRTDLKVKNTPTGKCFTCDICDQSNWLTETDVELHRKEAHLRGIVQLMEQYKERFCTICMKLQSNYSELVSHIKVRHLFSSPQARRVEREIFICDSCDHIFFNKDMLRAHVLNTHLWKSKDQRANKHYRCPKCKKLCKLKSIWFHLQQHEIPSISVCDICLTNFSDGKELEKHMKLHPMHFKCEICNYQTSKDFHFEAHLDQHERTEFKDRSGSTKRLIQEAFTKQSTKKLQRYNIHHSLKGLILPKFMYICVLCREICTDKIEVKTHLLRDHLKVEGVKKRYACICGEEFFNRVLLKHHIFKMKESGELHGDLDDNAVPQVSSSEQTDRHEDIINTSPQYIVIEEAPDQISNNPVAYNIYATVDGEMVSIDTVADEQAIGF